MNKKNIYFKADEQLLTNITPNCFASDTVAYIEAHFDLGENWSGFDSVRAVWTNGAAAISSVLYDGACIVPWEVLTKRAEVKVNLVGSNVENDELIDRLTTCQVPALNIKCKALIEGSNTATPTPSEYEQFVQNVHEDADRAEAARDEAEQILTDTEQIKTDVENLKTQTLAIKVETESIKGDVETLKSQTEDLVDGFNDEVEEALDRISAKEDDVLYDIDSAKTSALGEINDKETLALAEIVNAKSSALTDISSARVTSLTEIQTEGTTQKNLVTTEGQTQVANVQTEGETQIQAIEDKGAEVIASIPNFAPIITDTASGDIVSFTDGADGYPMKSVKVSLQPKQSGSGDPSPSNVRPISGWDEVNVYHSGADQTNPTIHSISFPSTVYGGEVSVIDGEGKSTMALIDLGSLTWSMNRTNIFEASISGLKGASYGAMPNLVCSQYKTITARNGGDMPSATDKSLTTNSVTYILYIKDTDYSSATAFKTAMNGVQLCYELANPTEFTTTPTEINSYKGNNTLWSDGAVECEYCADTKLYIDKKING